MKTERNRGKLNANFENERIQIFTERLKKEQSGSLMNDQRMNKKTNKLIFVILLFLSLTIKFRIRI